jgi:hypothetical protein
MTEQHTGFVPILKLINERLKAHDMGIHVLHSKQAEALLREARQMLLTARAAEQYAQENGHRSDQ